MLLATTLILLIVVATVIRRFRFWKKQGLKLQESGYLPPAPSRLGRAIFRLLSRLAVFLMVGPVKVIGRNNATGYRGRLIIVPNHTFQMDFTVISRAVPLDFRYMAATKELLGFRGLMGALTGAFGVDAKATGGAESAVAASVKVLTQRYDSRLLLFPQGKLIEDNVLRPEDFKTGAVRILRRTAELIDRQPAALLPVAIRYKRDPADASWFHRLVMKLGWKRFRRAFKQANYGVVAVIGEPIAVESLPENAREATEIMRTRIQALLEQANRN